MQQFGLGSPDGHPWWWLCALLILVTAGCQPMPGTTSPGYGSRMGMGPQNRAMGNSAFQSVAYGESAYGRVAFGPEVSTQGLFGPFTAGDNSLAQGTPVNSGAGNWQAPMAGTTTGATTNPFTQSQAGTPASGPWAQQVQNLSQQVNRYNLDNADLYQQMATLKQQLQNTNESNAQLQNELANAKTQVAQYQKLVQENEQRMQVMQTSSGNGAGFQGATIRANNSLLQNMNQLQVAGVTVNPDKDMIRVTIPSDYLFQAGTYNFQPASLATLNRLAAAIRQYYPSQIVGVEAHWTGSQDTVSDHQITTGQALSVMNQMVSAGLPASQMFVIGYGSNKPRFSNGSAQGQSANRRIELVIYPEQF